MNHCLENPTFKEIVYISDIHIINLKYINKYFIAQLLRLTKINTNTIRNFVSKMDSYELFPF